MADLVVFPDTDTIARAVLLHGLAEHGIAVPVATQLPHPMPDRFVRCFTLPGREVCRRTQWVQVVAQVYDVGAEVRCAELARLCGALLRAAPDTLIDGEDLPVTEPCEKHGPYPSLDPDFPTHDRYQVTVTWTVQSAVTP